MSFYFSFFYLSFYFYFSFLQTRYKVVDCMSSFRNFVQYHLKCAKSYFHSRMRLRVADLVKVLNRAKSTTDTNQPKRITTAAGKTLLR